MRKLIIILVVLLIGSSAFWLIRGRSMFADSLFSGFYVQVTKATGGDLVRILEIRNGGQILFTSDYGDKGFSRDGGSWEAAGTLLSVNVDSDNPHKIDFTKSRNGLLAVYYDESIYGQSGLTMYKFWPDSFEKSEEALRNYDINTEELFHSLLRGTWFVYSGSTADASNITFRNGRITGQLCNSFSGNYTFDNLKVKSDNIVSTKKACPDMTLENLVFSGLKDGLSLVLNSSNEAVLFSNKGERIDLKR